MERLRATDTGTAAPSTHRHDMAVLLFILALFIAIVPILVFSQRNFLLFHSLAEAFGVFVIAGVVMAGSYSWRGRENGYATFLSIAFGFAGLVLVIHMLAYRGMGVFPDASADLPTKLWLISRYLLASALLIAPWFLVHRPNRLVVALAYGAITALLLASVFVWDVFPAAFVPGEGLTPFKVASEYVVVTVFVIAGAVLVRMRHHFNRSAFRFVLGAIALLIATELAFTVYADVYGLANAVGHVLQVAAFACIFHAFVNVGISGPLRDAYHALEDSEARFRLLVESAPEAIFVQTGGRFAYVNGAALGTFGASAPEDLIGTPVADRFDEEFRNRVMQRIRTLNEDRRALPPADQLAVRLDGSTVWLAVSAVPIRFGDEEGALVFARDVSARKKAERELEGHRDRLEELVQARTSDLEAANAELTRASQAKSRFLANVSHELRTPLNSIIGFSSVLAQGLAGPLSEEQQTQVDMINASGRYLLTLVDDVLDLSKVEAGKTEIHITRVEPALMLAEVAEIMRPLAEQKSLAFGVESSDSIEPFESDAGKVKQILLNLLGNAVKFTESGRVDVTARESADGAVVFSVSDTGPGIEPATIPRVFDSFTQFAQGGEAKPKGTGLGLAISREYALAIGGTLEVTSEVGEGSTFALTLPVRPPL